MPRRCAGDGGGAVVVVQVALQGRRWLGGCCCAAAAGCAAVGLLITDDGVDVAIFSQIFIIIVCCISDISTCKSRSRLSSVGRATP